MPNYGCAHHKATRSPGGREISLPRFRVASSEPQKSSITLTVRPRSDGLLTMSLKSTPRHELITASHKILAGDRSVNVSRPSERGLRRVDALVGRIHFDNFSTTVQSPRLHVNYENPEN